MIKPLAMELAQPKERLKSMSNLGNQFQAEGYLGQDPVIRETRSGKPVMNFDVAVRDPNSTKDKPLDKMWVKVVGWEWIATYIERFNIKKGDKVMVSGSVRLDTWHPDQGEKRVSMLINAGSFKLISRKSDRIIIEEHDGGQEGMQSEKPAGNSTGNNDSGDDSDDGWDE